MEIKGIKYIGPIFDGSGYAQACRANILALYKLGVPITIKSMSFEAATPELGEDGIILDSLLNKHIEYSHVIIHSTPEFWADHIEFGKINVGYTIWETNKLHPKWKDYINNTVDIVLVGCEWNIGVFKCSGVTKPIFSVPHGISTDAFKSAKNYNIEGLSEDAYVFYNISQFTERKHPIALLKAYWYAFQKGENVALVLKTYRSDYSDQEKDVIRNTISKLKFVTPMENYPKVYFVSDMLTNDEILGLHTMGDCYVSLDRGEGFGLSPFTAGACGNPIIVTGFGGVTEYAKEDNSYLVNYTLTPVSGMPWCMSLKSLVKTSDGYITADRLKEDNKVENKNLNVMNINKIAFRHLLDSECVYSLKYFSVSNTTELTPNHKLYVLDKNDVPVKKKVSDINVGDYLYVPKPSIKNDLIIDDVPYDKYDNLFYLFGLYLAEGYVDRDRKYIHFSFNINEKNTIASKCKAYMYNLFSSNINHFYDRELSDRNGYEMLFYCDNSLMDLFEENFGCGSHFKFISNQIKYNENNKYLLKGYWDGDGHIRKEGYKSKKTGKRRISPECVAETASFDLSMDIRDILLSLDIVPSIYNSNRKDGRISYIISVSDENFDKLFDIKANRINSKFKKKIKDGFGVLVTKKELIEDYDDLICSISVDVDYDETIVDGGSYILNGIASSNSPWYRGDQLWAEPNVAEAACVMEYVYENREEAKDKGLKLKEYINTNFSWEVIGNKIIKAIQY